MLRHVLVFFCVSVLLLVDGCGNGQGRYQPEFSDQATTADGKKQIVFGIHPLHNPEKLFERYGPIIEYLNRHISGVQFTLEASRNYEEFDKKLYAGYFDFALPNPYQTINAIGHGYHVFGKMGDDANFRGILLIRRDSKIHAVTDLKGKRVSYPAKTALAATMMPQYYLQTHGIDVGKDIENIYVGSQESSIMNVYLGAVAAAATWPVPWRAFQKEHPDQAAQLEVAWQTEPLVNNALVARDNMPPDLVTSVTDLLLHLQDTPEGRAMLEKLPISRFEPANDGTYDVVRLFIKQFAETVNPLIK